MKVLATSVNGGSGGGREKAKGATFFEATEGETVRPMLDVAWAPMLGAFSVLFEEFAEGAWHVTSNS